MPRMKADELEFDIKELDDAEYNEDFAEYDGPEPPKRTRLSGRIKKMWLSETRPETGSKPMLVVLFEAEGNTGEKEQYNGCPIWERLPLIASAKFRWQPFLDATGLNLRQIKNKMFVAESDDGVGAPIEKIDKWVPGSEDALVDVVTDRERYEGEWTTKVGKFLELSDEYDSDAVADEEDEEDEELDEDLDEDEETEDEDDEYDEDDDEADDEDDDEDEPEPPARGRRAASRPAASAAKGKAAPARTTRTAKPATTRAAKAEPAKAATTRGTRAAAARTTTKAKTATSTKRGGRKPAQEIDDEPPF